MRLSCYFQQKPVLRWLLEVRKWGSHSFSFRSLLLSTTVLNDNKGKSFIVFE